MTKKDLIIKISKESGKTVAQVKEFMGIINDNIIKAAVETGSCPVLSFGKIIKIDMAAKSGKIKGKPWSTEAKTVLKLKILDSAKEVK